MEERAQRFNDGKLRWSLVDFEALEELVRVLEMGANKYSANNWRKGMPITKVCESLSRHLFAFMNGEDTDPESGLSHIGHVMCNAMFILNFMKHKPTMDDRYKEHYVKFELDDFKSLNERIAKAEAKKLRYNPDDQTNK